MKITVNLEDTKPLKHSKRYNVRIFHSSTLDEIHEFDTLQAAHDYAAKQKDFCLISMVLEETNYN